MSELFKQISLLHFNKYSFKYPTDGRTRHHEPAVCLSINTCLGCDVRTLIMMQEIKGLSLLWADTQGSYFCQMPENLLDFQNKTLSFDARTKTETDLSACFGRERLCSWVYNTYVWLRSCVSLYLLQKRLGLPTPAVQRHNIEQNRSRAVPQRIHNQSQSQVMFLSSQIYFWALWQQLNTVAFI